MENKTREELFEKLSFENKMRYKFGEIRNTMKRISYYQSLLLLAILIFGTLIIFVINNDIYYYVLSCIGAFSYFLVYILDIIFNVKNNNKLDTFLIEKSKEK